MIDKNRKERNFQMGKRERNESTHACQVKSCIYNEEAMVTFESVCWLAYEKLSSVLKCNGIQCLSPLSNLSTRPQRLLWAENHSRYG